jgi:putative sterol carrier protein
MAKTIDEYFAMMPAAFQKGLAAGLAATYQFDLSGEGGGKWFVVIRNGELEIGKGEKQNPDVTLLAAARDYVEIAEGRMNSMLAMATGKFKIKGHLGLAMKLQKVFKY